MMNVRRAMLMRENELYPVGTDVITKYIGRDSNGKGLFVGHMEINVKNGQYVEATTDRAASPVFIPIRSGYVMQKSSDGRLNACAYYDADYNFIAGFSYNNLNVIDFTIPDGAAYMRITTHLNRNNWGVKITRIA